MEFVVQVLGVRNGMKFVVQEFLSIRVKMELVIQRFMVRGSGAMTELHLGPGWNTFGSPAIGSGPDTIWAWARHAFGPRNISHLGLGILHLDPRPSLIWAQDQIAFKPRSKFYMGQGAIRIWAHSQIIFVARAEFSLGPGPN